ncbi:MAG: hypothetical protein OXH24_02645 [Cyanobacteria bacterium MAG IRC3_bin_20]|nr:hypothetical protein [Cyanobacteria bacterium MAG IRC3_bin_20]
MVSINAFVRVSSRILLKFLNKLRGFLLIYQNHILSKQAISIFKQRQSFNVGTALKTIGAFVGINCNVSTPLLLFSNGITNEIQASENRNREELKEVKLALEKMIAFMRFLMMFRKLKII